jgi:ABC-type transport system involved in multi-copper enzyme maturation permease subunit
MKGWLIARKDLQQHATVLLLYLLTSVLFPLSMLVVDNYVPHRVHDNGLESRSLFGVSITVATLAPLLIAHLLISIEKSKRTLLTLTLLPVRRETIVLSKELLASGLLLVLYAVNLGSTFCSFRLMRGEWGARPSATFLLELGTALVVATQICLWLFVKYQQRIAYQIPFVAAMLGRPAWLVLGDSFPSVVHAVSTGLLKIIWVVAPLAALLCHKLLVHAFENQDWSKETLD